MNRLITAIGEVAALLSMAGLPQMRLTNPNNASLRANLEGATNSTEAQTVKSGDADRGGTQASSTITLGKVSTKNIGVGIFMQTPPATLDGNETTRSRVVQFTRENECAVRMALRRESCDPGIEHPVESSCDIKSLVLCQGAFDPGIEWMDWFPRKWKLNTEGFDDADWACIVRAWEKQGTKPGMVMVIDREHDGKMVPCSAEYDQAVVGVLSGAHGQAPDMALSAQRQAHVDVGDDTMRLAMTGRMWVCCDATTTSVHPGDLLVTSSTPGHSMSASDISKRHGAVLGKAMTGLSEGKGLVLVLVNLQ